jgi:RHS repeat-associated protein
MARPTGWDILGLDGDPTPGVVESVQALAREFGDFAHDVESAYRSLNSFGSDTTALQWVGQTADAFKSNYGPLPGRLQKLYTSYSEASDALSAYAPRLQAAQSKADAALRQAQDAQVDLQRANTAANNAATDLKTAQQNQAAAPNQKAVTDAQTAHNTAQTSLANAKSAMAALTKQANDAYNDRINAAKICASAIGHAQSDGIHNKHWWEHIGADLAEWGGKIADIANDLAPFLDVLALATSWIPGVDVITAGLAEADNLIALAGTGLEIAGDAMQGHWGDALMGAGMLGVTFLGGKALEKFGGKALEAVTSKIGKDAENDVAAEARTAEGNATSICKDDPVDVVSGWMLTHQIDLELPGVLPLVLRRAYATGYATGHLFGPGWSSTLDQRLSVNESGIHFAGDDAQRLDYQLPTDLEPVLPTRGVQWSLVWDREIDEIRITDPWSGQTRHFASVHFRNEDGQIRDMTAMSDRHGNRIDITRDEHGTPTMVEHAAYRIAVDTVISVAGPRVTEIRLLDGSADGIAVRRYQYDDRGRLTGVVNASGLPFAFEWDSADRINAWVDRLGYRYGYEYDDQGRVVCTIGDDGYLSGHFSYDSANRVTTHTGSLGDTTTFRYDERGHVCAETDAFESTTLSEYDFAGRLLERTDPLGHVTRYQYDDSGNLASEVVADGSVTAFAYDELRQMTLVQLPDTAVWRQEFDQNGNLLAVTDPLGARVGYEYERSGALQAVVDSCGNTTRYLNDAAGLALAVTDPLGGVTLISRNAFGRVTAVRDPLGAVTEYTWTQEGRPAKQVNPDGTSLEWHYDAEGEPIAAVDPRGGITRFIPGPFGLPVTRLDPNGDRYEFRYDAELRLVSVVNPAGACWSYEYDLVGNLTSETDFLGHTSTYEYNAAGWLVKRTDTCGRGSEFLHDAMGRMIGRRTDDGEFAYTYDGLGRLMSATSTDSSLALTRDALGQVLSEAVDGRSILYAYDAANRMTGRRTPSGTESVWDYDTAGRPARLQAGNRSLAFEHDAAGRQTVVAADGGARLQQDLDVLGRPTSLRVSAPTLQPSLIRSYRYAADGSPSEVTDAARGTRLFTLDPMGRVASVTGTDWTEAYGYDQFGNVNRAAVPADGGEADRETYRTLVRRAGRMTYQHDDAGRLVGKSRRTLDGRRLQWAYTWDSDDQLVEASLPNGTVWRYRYDPIGRRIAKERLDSEGTAVEQVIFVWDGDRLAEQQSTSANGRLSSLTWHYEPESFRPVAQSRTSWADGADQEKIDEAFHAIVTDLAGAPTELIAPDGRVSWVLTATLWGRASEARADPDTGCPLRFAGHYHDDETDLNYNRHRYYDPDTSSYLTPDPLGLAPAPNDHAYVPNPLTWTDPLGLAGKTKCDPEITVYHYTHKAGFNGIKSGDPYHLIAQDGSKNGRGIWVTTLSPAELKAPGAFKSRLGITSAKSQYVMEFTIPKSQLVPLRGGRGAHILRIPDTIDVPRAKTRYIGPTADWSPPE